MKKLTLLSAMTLVALLPQAGAAQSIFDTFFDEATGVRSVSDPSPALTAFVIDEMKDWNGTGIILTENDIKQALQAGLGAASTLCLNKTTPLGVPLTFSAGSPLQGGGCIALQSDIISLVNAEHEAIQLGNDLLQLSSASELAIADEPHRPVQMGTLSLLVRRVWSGAGETITPWDGTAAAGITALEAKLNALSPEDLDKAVTRFHFGYYRDDREDDPRFQAPNIDDIGTQLKNIADILGVTDDPSAVGEFASPKLKVKNVAIWIRKDDIGIHWVYPTHVPELPIKKAGAYPTIVSSPNADKLAYPFEYKGSSVPVDPRIRSPLCSRTIGRYGYLCRAVPDTNTNCVNTNPGEISLVECQKKTTETDKGPAICIGLDNLYKDTGISLTDPANPSRLNPALAGQAADPKTICSPENAVMYVDDISSHACYIGMCLAQSMDGHSLVPNRNPVVTNETTSPYQSCMRQDPELGLYAEPTSPSPFPLPTYIGHELVQDFERAYCKKSGDLVRPVLADCTFKSDLTAAELPTEQNAAASVLVRGAADASQTQESFLSLAGLIGQRVAEDQMILVEKKLYASVAQFISQMASLLLELKRAPVTQTACPWTGPFPSFGF